MGLGDIGTLGSGGKASTKPPRLGHGTTTTSGSGKLPVEVIDRIVRQQYGRFRLCYEKGLQSDPTLTGKVTVKFVIDASGNVSSVTDGGSDLKDSTTTGCVLRGLKNASFPRADRWHRDRELPTHVHAASPLKAVAALQRLHGGVAAREAVAARCQLRRRLVELRHERLRFGALDRQPARVDVGETLLDLGLQAQRLRRGRAYGRARVARLADLRRLAGRRFQRVDHRGQAVVRCHPVAMDRFDDGRRVGAVVAAAEE